MHTHISMPLRICLAVMNTLLKVLKIKSEKVRKKNIYIKIKQCISFFY